MKSLIGLVLILCSLGLGPPAKAASEAPGILVNGAPEEWSSVPFLWVCQGVQPSPAPSIFVDILPVQTRGLAARFRLRILSPCSETFSYSTVADLSDVVEESRSDKTIYRGQQGDQSVELNVVPTPENSRIAWAHLKFVHMARIRSSVVPIESSAELRCIKIL